MWVLSQALMNAERQRSADAGLAPGKNASGSQFTPTHISLSTAYDDARGVLRMHRNSAQGQAPGAAGLNRISLVHLQTRDQGERFEPRHSKVGSRPYVILGALISADVWRGADSWEDGKRRDGRLYQAFF